MAMEGVGGQPPETGGGCGQRRRRAVLLRCYASGQQQWALLTSGWQELPVDQGSFELG